MRLSALLYDKSERYRNLAEFRTSPTARDAAKEHHELMNAVIERDTERAAKLINDHFWGTANIILESDLFNPTPARQTKRRTLN